MPFYFSLTCPFSILSFLSPLEAMQEINADDRAGSTVIMVLLTFTNFAGYLQLLQNWILDIF